MKRLATGAGIAVSLLLLSGILSSGTLWEENGTPVCTETDYQQYPEIVSDGQGGAVVVWQDMRNAIEDIYAQRMSASGKALWTTGGVCICEEDGVQDYPRLISDGSGGAIIVWRDYRSGSGSTDIYAQRIDAAGNAVWAEGGVPVCTAADYQSDEEIAPDGSGGAIIVWRDFRNGSSNTDIYAQRIAADGTARWTADGVGICTLSSYQGLPAIIPDRSGGAIIAWTGTNVVSVQRVDSLGALQWTAGGVLLCSVSGAKNSPLIASDGSGGAIVTWMDYRSGTSWDVYAGRVDYSGTRRWSLDGIAICAMPFMQYAYGIDSSGPSQAIIVWQDDRSDTSKVYAQKIDTSGAVHWGADGIRICAAEESQAYPDIVADGSGGAVITWQDYRGGMDADIYAQRIDTDGIPLWAPEGVMICKMRDEQMNPRIAAPGDGGAIIVWEDMRSLSDFDIYAVRVSDEGVGTLLESFSAGFDETGITVRWTLAESGDRVEFIISRAVLPDGDFMRVPDMEITRERNTCFFLDDGIERGASYRYRIEASDEAGRRVLFETGPIAVPPLSLALLQNYPNPFNPSTAIEYFLPEKGRVRLDIFDASGRRIVRLADGLQSGGRHVAEWHGQDESGRALASGVYFCKLRFEKSEITKKLVLLR